MLWRPWDQYINGIVCNGMVSLGSIVWYGVPRADGMRSNAQSAADECTDKAIHVIHKSHNAGMQQLLAYIVSQGQAYASEIAGNGK